MHYEDFSQCGETTAHISAPQNCSDSLGFTTEEFTTNALQHLLLVKDSFLAERCLLKSVIHPWQPLSSLGPHWTYLPQWIYLLLHFQPHALGLQICPAWQLAVATEKSGSRFQKALNLITLWNFILCHACRLKPHLSEWEHFLQLNRKAWIQGIKCFILPSKENSRTSMEDSKEAKLWGKILVFQSLSLFWYIKPIELFWLEKTSQVIIQLLTTITICAFLLLDNWKLDENINNLIINAGIIIQKSIYQLTFENIILM